MASPEAGKAIPSPRTTAPLHTVGNSKSLLIDSGRLVLGRWQGVFFCEFDGPRRRELRIKVAPD
jgi:thiamine phosphate synthase YjbQ (UPF0047 family)